MNKKKLSQLTEKWKEQGLITVEQANQIIENTPSAVDNLQKRLPIVFAMLGIVLIAAGIFKLIANNWEALSQLTKLGLLLAAMSVSYYSGYEIKFRRANYPRIGEALMLLGALLFGSGMALVSQMYHYSGDFKEFLLIWSVASLLLAFAIKSKPIAVLGLIVLMVWAQISWYTNPPGFLYLAIIIFFLGSLLNMNQYSKNFKKTFQVMGLITILLANFFIIDFNGWFYYGSSNRTSLYIIIPIAVTIMLGALIYELANKRALSEYLPFITITVMGVYPLIPLDREKLYGDLFMGVAKEPVGIVASLLANVDNIYFLGLTILLLFMGYIRKERYIINLAIVFFLLHSAFVYFYLMSTQMAGVWFFLLGGILLLSIAFGFEFIRRRINKRLQDV